MAGKKSTRRSAKGARPKRRVASRTARKPQAKKATAPKSARALAEALEQQAATSEILRIIARSPSDVQPVFDTIAAAALKLCNAGSAVVTRFDGELLRLAALANVSPEGADAMRARYPRPPGRDNASSRAILTGKLVTIPTCSRTASTRSAVRWSARRLPQRSWRCPCYATDARSGQSQSAGLNPDHSRQADRAAPDLRRSGGDRDRERAAVQRAGSAQPRPHRSAGAADRDERDPARDQPVADRCAARVRHDRGSSAEAVRRGAAVSVYTFDGELIRSGGSCERICREGDDALRQAVSEAAEPRDRGYPGRADSAASSRFPTCWKIPNTQSRMPRSRLVSAASLACPLLRDGSPIGAIARRSARSLDRSPTSRSPCSRPSPTRRSSRSRTCGCSRSWRRATATSPRRLSSRPRRATSCSVISQSQTNVQPVFDTIAAHALKLCNASSVTCYTVRRRTT